MVVVALLVSLLNSMDIMAIDDNQSTCARLTVIGVDMVVDRTVGLIQWLVYCSWEAEALLMEALLLKLEIL